MIMLWRQSIEDRIGREIEEGEAEWVASMLKRGFEQVVNEWIAAERHVLLVRQKMQLEEAIEDALSAYA
jgi:hypothetical protein